MTIKEALTPLLPSGVDIEEASDSSFCVRADGSRAATSPLAFASAAQSFDETAVEVAAIAMLALLQDFVMGWTTEPWPVVRGLRRVSAPWAAIAGDTFRFGFEEAGGPRVEFGRLRLRPIPPLGG